MLKRVRRFVQPDTVNVYPEVRPPVWFNGTSPQRKQAWPRNRSYRGIMYVFTRKCQGVQWDLLLGNYANRCLTLRTLNLENLWVLQVGTVA